jgi:hypothetical protein
MDNSGPLNKVFDTRFEEIRKIWRPKLCWENSMIQDTRGLGVNNWRNVAEASERQGPHRISKPIKMIRTVSSKQMDPNDVRTWQIHLLGTASRWTTAGSEAQYSTVMQHWILNPDDIFFI